MDTNWLDAVERISRAASIAAPPVVLAVGGWVIQRQLQSRTVSRDYVRLAVTLLQDPDQSKVPPELREWAVDLLDANSPTKLNAKAKDSLKSGAATLPSFSFVPSTALTPALKTELETSLKAFQAYLVELGFSSAMRPVSVEISAGTEAVLRAAARAEGLHLDAESSEHLQEAAKVHPNFKMTMNAAVWRGSNDNEFVASAMDQFDHLGQVWIAFAKGTDPARNRRFQESAMRKIVLRWPGTLSLPIMPTGAIPLKSDLLRTPSGYVVDPSAASRYQVAGVVSPTH